MKFKIENTLKIISPRFIVNFLFAVIALFFVRSLPLHIEKVPVFDDAYMFSRYAYNLAIHGEYAWNAGEPSYGSTSVFNTFWLAIPYFFGLNKIWSDKTILLANTHFWLLATLVLWYKIVVFLAKNPLNVSVLNLEQENSKSENLDINIEEKTTRNLFFLVANLFFLFNIFQKNLGNGMETTMSIFGNSALIFLLIKYRNTANFWQLFGVAFAAYCVFLIRPDCGLYATVFPVLFFYAVGLPFKKIMQFAAIISAFLLLDSIVKYAYFGYILPLPFYVKKASFYEGYMDFRAWCPQQYLEPFLGVLMPAILSAALFLQKKDWKIAFAFAAPTLITMIYMTSVLQIMGDHSRYYMPSLPFILLGSLAIANGFEKKISTNNLILLCSAIVFCHFFVRFATTYNVKQTAIAEEQAKKYPHIQFGHRVNGLYENWEAGLIGFSNILKKLPTNLNVAASEYGLASVENKETKIMDWAGLHNKDVAFGRGFEQSLTRYKPELIWMPQPHDSKLYFNICSNKYFQENYDFYPNTMLYGMAIKKNSPYRKIILQALHEQKSVLWGELKELENW